MLCGAAVLAQVAVLTVAKNRVTKMRQMATQLMLTTGFRLQLHQPVTGGRVAPGGDRHFHRRQAAIVSYRWLRVFIFAGELIGDFIELFHPNG